VGSRVGLSFEAKRDIFLPFFADLDLTRGLEKLWQGILSMKRLREITAAKEILERDMRGEKVVSQ
jgi:hypothetical protein